MKEELETAK
jgi:hypothetical protein